MASYRRIWCVFCASVLICLQFIAAYPYSKPKNVPQRHTYTFHHAMWSTLVATLASRLQFEVWNDIKKTLFVYCIFSRHRPSQLSSMDLSSFRLAPPVLVRWRRLLRGGNIYWDFNVCSLLDKWNFWEGNHNLWVLGVERQWVCCIPVG